MEIVISASAKKNYGNGPLPCMIFCFDTGHKFTRWTDGTELFTNKAGRLMNPDKGCGLKLVAEMRRLADAEFGCCW